MDKNKGVQLYKLGESYVTKEILNALYMTCSGTLPNEPAGIFYPYAEGEVKHIYEEEVKFTTRRYGDGTEV